MDKRWANLGRIVLSLHLFISLILMFPIFIISPITIIAWAIGIGITASCLFWANISFLYDILKKCK